MCVAPAHAHALTHTGGKLWAYLVLRGAGLSQGASLSDYINPHTFFDQFGGCLEVSTVEVGFRFVRTHGSIILHKDHNESIFDNRLATHCILGYI